MISEAHQRRVFLKSALAVISSLIVPSVGYSRWDKNAYNKTEIVASVQSVGVTNLADLREGGGKITLLTPKIAENGAIVPITVNSKIPNTERIFIFAEKKWFLKNPYNENYIRAQDYELWIRTSEKNSFGILNTALLFYREVSSNDFEKYLKAYKSNKQAILLHKKNIDFQDRKFFLV